MPHKLFKKIRFLRVLAFSLSALTLSSCTKEEEPYINLPVTGPDQIFYAISGNNLLIYNAKGVKTPLSTVAISGFTAATTDERLLSIDFRPSTGELYAVSSASKIYVVNVSTGVLRQVSSTALSTPLTSVNASIDFNPTSDRIRLITDKGQNVVINPENAAASATTNTPLNLVAAAYNNNAAGATSTVLYNIDATTNKLYKQDAPNTGVTTEVGSLDVAIGQLVSMDISPDGKNALTVSKTSEGTRLFSIDLTTGKATLEGKFPAEITIQSIAMPTSPVAYAVQENNLLIFNPTIVNEAFVKPITGLQAGETVLGMDMRPINGQIYAIGSASNLYLVNPTTGDFSLVSEISPALSGTGFGMNFDPVNDRITVVSNTAQSLTITAAGVITSNAAIGGTPTITALAYTNNNANAQTSTVYAVSDNSDQLFKLNPTTGVLTLVGDLKVDVTAVNGFDIISSGTSKNVATAIFNVNGAHNFYSIDLTTGLATKQGGINKPWAGFTLGLRF